MKVLKIVLTGGPCAGKTTLINDLRSHLESKENSHVIVIPETATLMSSSGIPPFGGINAPYFQDLVYQMQYTKEKIAEESVELFKDCENIYILYDRGIIDNKAYLESQNEFDDILNKYGHNELEIIDKYDVVFDLISTANSRLVAYNKESNSERVEDEEYAKIVDRKTSNAWLLHRNIKVIEPFSSIEEKSCYLLNEVEDICNKKEERMYDRYLISNISNDDIPSVKYDVIEYVIEDINDTRITIEERVYKDYSTYIYKVIKYIDNKELIIRDDKITNNQFKELMKQYKIRRINNMNVEKKVIDNHICSFINGDGYIILEIEKTKQNINKSFFNNGKGTLMNEKEYRELLNDRNKPILKKLVL